MIVLRNLKFVLIMLCIYSCSNSKFLKDKSSTAETLQQAEDAVVQNELPPTTSTLQPDEVNPISSPAPATAMVSETDTVTDPSTALNDCLKQWGKTPFSDKDIAQVKIIDINESINNNGAIYTDNNISANPTLFLINFNIKIGNGGELNLLNPKAWYCFNVQAKIINNFVLNLACDTRLAIVTKVAQNEKRFTIARPESCSGIVP